MGRRSNWYGGGHRDCCPSFRTLFAVIAAEVLSTSAAIFPCESDTARVSFATFTLMIRWASLELVIVPIRVNASCPTRAALATVRVQTTIHTISLSHDVEHPGI